MKPDLITTKAKQKSIYIKRQSYKRSRAASKDKKNKQPKNTKNPQGQNNHYQQEMRTECIN